MKKKVIGILGGMGPLATADLFEKITLHTRAQRDQDHLRVLIDSNTNIPDRTAALLRGGEDPTPQLTASAVLLERMGADVLIMPCNTAHNFYDAIAAAVHIPVLHMIRLTAQALQKRGVTAAGLLATDGTVRTGVYQRECEAQGLTAFSPPPEVQKVVMSIIYDEIKKGEKGSREKFAVMDRCLREAGCDAAILGCTELSVYRTYHPLPEFYVDAMDILAERCITYCGYKLRMV